MGTAFLVNGTLPNGKVLLGLPNSHLHRGGFPHQVRSLRLCRQPVDFLVWLRRLLIAFQTNSRHALKQCFQSNRYARQSGENLPKVCPRKRRYPHFDYGKLSICANGPFYFVGIVFCWTIYQTKERVKFNVFSKFASFIRT